jgi:hypothetical protein
VSPFFNDAEEATVKRFVRPVLVAAVAVVGSMPMTVAHASSTGPCDGHGGVRSASAKPAGQGFDVMVGCADGVRRGPYRETAAGGYPCADHGGVAAATARPGAGVIEVIVYCNDGQSEGPYEFEIR